MKILFFPLIKRYNFQPKKKKIKHNASYTYFLYIYIQNRTFENKNQGTKKNARLRRQIIYFKPKIVYSHTKEIAVEIAKFHNCFMTRMFLSI